MRVPRDCEPISGFIKFLKCTARYTDSKTLRCRITRLRVNVKDVSLVNDELINKTPNSGIVKKENDIQVIYGLHVPDIRKAVEELL